MIPLDIQNFLTIEKLEYSYWVWRNILKKIRLYDKKSDFLPPTINYTYNYEVLKKIPVCEKYEPLVYYFQKNDINDEIKERFKKNIEIQWKVLEKIKARKEKNYKCWLIKLSTWIWKSHVIIDIIELYNVPTLILVHNIKTMTDMHNNFKKFTNYKKIWLWWWQHKKEKEITIMTKKSFCLHYDKLENNYWLILVDEAPVWFSSMFYYTMNKYNNNRKWVWFYGLSATPEKIDLNEQDLAKYFGRIIQVNEEDEEKIQPKFKMFDYRYHWIYLYENPAEMRTALTENKERIKIQIEKARELIQWRNCILILTDRVSEAEYFYNNVWWNKYIITWKTKDVDDIAKIKEAEEKIKQGKKIILIWTSQKIWIWVDIPFIDCIMLISAIKFHSTVIQSVWRWLRKYEWKKDCLIWIWNDLPHYQGQKREKIKTIETYYWMNKTNIEIENIF